MIFRRWKHILFAVHRAAGRCKDDLPAAMFHRLLQQVQHPENVHLRIENGILDRSPDIHLRRKMDDERGTLFAENLLDPRTLDVDLVKFSGPIDVPPFAGREVINDDDIVSLLHQSIDEMRADKAGPTGHENLHAELLSPCAPCVWTCDAPLRPSVPCLDT